MNHFVAEIGAICFFIFFFFIWFTRDMGLDTKRNWLANDTSDAYVALEWVDVGRGLLPLL